MAQLTKDIIADTTYCQLGLRISPSRLDVMIYNPMEDNSLVHEAFEIDAAEPLKSLEEIVYDNPLLLNLFKKTNVVLESQFFCLVPGVIKEESIRRELLRQAHPDADNHYEMIVNDMPELGATFLTAVEAKLLNFLRRTFDNPPIMLNLSLLAKYYRPQIPKGGTIRMYVNLHAASADVIILSSDAILLANRFAFRELDDLVYYILASVKALDIAMPEILISGIRENRDNLLSQLRNFCPTVMPTIFPSAMYRAGKNSINAPFDLIILPLCE